MNLVSKEVIKGLLGKYYIKPSKRLGQNFLVDKKVLQKIVKTANLQTEDIVLEIGPGIGILTQELAKYAKKVIAVEKDPRMVEILKTTLKNFNNIKIIRGDILKIINSQSPIPNKIPKAKCQRLEIRNWKLGIRNSKVVANLPYYITSPVIRKFLEMDNPPKLMVLMVQKEVAQRICAKPPHLRRSVAKAMERRRQGYGGQAKMNLLAVSVQFYAKPEIISYISKKSFWPQPKVDSAIIKITPRQFRLSVSRRFREQFFRIVRAGFSQPRKQLANNLSKVLKLDKAKVISWLLKNNIKPTQRAETLSIKNWLKLTKTISLY